MKVSRIAAVVVVASVCLIALGAAGWRGTTDNSTLHRKGRGGHGFGRGCNSHQATSENLAATPLSMAHQGRGKGRGQGWGQTRLASFSQTSQGCDKSTGGCQDGGTCSKSRPSSKGCGSTQGCNTSHGGCQDHSACGTRQECGSASSDCGSGCSGGSHANTACGSKKGGCDDSSKSGCGGCSAATGTCETKTGCNLDSEEADTLAAIGIGEPHLPWWMNADSASDGCSRGKSQCGKKKAECGDECDTTSKDEPDVARSSD